MDAYPVIAGNITQTLFKQNEKLIVPSNSVSAAYQNLSSLSGINSMPQEINNMQSQMPAFISQAHLSTWYQDNPYSTLTYSAKYGVPVLGGNIDPTQPPGHKPGNTYLNYSGHPSSAQNYQSIVSNMKNTQIMKENFENEIKIHWQ